MLQNISRTLSERVIIHDIAPLVAPSIMQNAGVLPILASNPQAYGCERVHVTPAQFLEPSLDASARKNCTVSLDWHQSPPTASFCLEQLIEKGATNFSVTVPSGDISSRKVFNLPIQAATDASQDLIAELLTVGKSTNVTAVMRSALTCEYEGGFVSAKRCALLTMELQALGCQNVCWEDSAGGGRPRAVENLLKTAAAMGCNMQGVSFCFRADADGDTVTASCEKALEIGVRNFMASTASPTKVGGDDFSVLAPLQGAKRPIRPDELIRCIMQVTEGDPNTEEFQEQLETLREASSISEALANLG